MAFLDPSNGFFGWLGRASWQAVIVILLVLAAQRIFGKYLSPRWRHALWLLVVIRMAVPGTIESRLSLFNLFHTPSLPTQTRSPDDGVIAAPGGEQKDSSIAASPASSRYFRSWIGVSSIWLAGAALLSGYWAATAWRLWRRIGRQRPVTNEAVLSLLEDCKEEMGVLTPVTVIETAAVRSPALWGFVRPRLLLPKGLIQSFSLPELRFVFLHELGHLKRWDILLNWLMAFPLVLHWFNPVVWYAVIRMRVDGEAACDAAALAHVRDGENRLYGQTIIKLLERFNRPALAPGLVGILANKNQMKRRIAMIAGFKRGQRWPLLGAPLFGILGIITLTDAQSQQPVGGEGRQEEPIGEASVRWRPRVIATSPTVGDSEVDPGIAELTVTFDRDMSAGMSWTRRYHEAEYPPARESRNAFWRDQRTCVLPVKLEPGQFYRVELNPRPPYQNFRGANGRAAIQSVLYFATQGASEAVKAKLRKPKVVSLVPSRSETNVGADLKELRVTFDTRMGKGYSWIGVGEICRNSRDRPGYWIDDYTCVLPVVLKPEHDYHLGINGEIAVNFQSADGGVPCEPLAYDFKTRK